MLSDLLKLLRIRAEVYHNAKVCGDWVIPEGHIGQTCFHLPIEGECFLRLPNGPTMTLRAGDLVIFPRETAHKMLPTQTLSGPQQHLPYAQAPSQGTGLLCGRLHFQHAAYHVLLDSLPSPLIITAEQAKPWLSPLLALLLNESYSDNPSDVLLNRICELVFIYALQSHGKNTMKNQGVFKLYAIEKLVPAITAMHKHPALGWTLESLAKCCHMSRTAFTLLFKQSGWTPMRYLTWWRLQLGYQYLQNGDTLAQTAAAIGYHSEPAFSRAFQKEFSISPGLFRRNHRGVSG